MMLAMACVFLMLFSATFYLRWQTRELSFSGAGSTMVDTTGQVSGIEDADSDSDEAIAITILLGILPGVTSAINLALGYFNDDPVKRRLKTMETELVKLREQKNIMCAARSELEQDWLGRLSQLDQDRCRAVCASVHGTTEQIKALARLELAKKLQDPDSISALTEPKLAPAEL